MPTAADNTTGGGLSATLCRACRRMRVLCVERWYRRRALILFRLHRAVEVGHAVRRRWRRVCTGGGHARTARELHRLQVRRRHGVVVVGMGVRMRVRMRKVVHVARVLVDGRCESTVEWAEPHRWHRA